MEQWTLPRIWEGLIKTSDYLARREAVEKYNQQNFWRKRGISINPCRYTYAYPPQKSHACQAWKKSSLKFGCKVGQGKVSLAAMLLCICHMIYIEVGHKKISCILGKNRPPAEPTYEQRSQGKLFTEGA